ncbi:MAG: GNAT family N-acetyltransferase [Deltaproteobacteria bacterium]|nr:GNAT family N-acetyltransferase [Deltaproteobacteria bacterium]
MLRREGLSGILLSLPSKIATDSFGAARVMVLENKLTGPLGMIPAEPNLVIRQMDESDLQRFREPESFLKERRIADFAARLKSGRRCFLALAAGRACGYGWLSRQTEIDARCGIEILPGEDEGYIYDGFVFPAFRRRGVYARLLFARLDWLQREGCQRVYSIVFSNNVPALNAHWQAGFRPYGQMSYSKIFNLRWRRKYALCPPGAGSQ